MAVLSLTDAVILAGGYDFSAASNTVRLSTSVDVLDSTTFGSGGNRERVAGLRDAQAEVSGFWAATPDSAAFANLSLTDVPFTISPTGDDGDPAYISQMQALSYNTGGAIGELLPFDFMAKGKGYGAIRSTLLHPIATARSSSGTGTGRQLGAVSSTQRLFLSLHVTSVSGTTPSLTVVVQQDDNSGFSTPTTVHTFTAATGITSEFTSVAGPITDDYFRVTWTISGSSPSFNFSVAAGIQ